MVAVGPGRKEDDNVVPVNVSVGSTILYSKYSGTELEVGWFWCDEHRSNQVADHFEFALQDDDKQYIVIRETDVLAELA